MSPGVSGRVPPRGKLWWTGPGEVGVFLSVFGSTHLTFSSPSSRPSLNLVPTFLPVVGRCVRGGPTREESLRGVSSGTTGRSDPRLSRASCHSVRPPYPPRPRKGGTRTETGVFRTFRKCGGELRPQRGSSLRWGYRVSRDTPAHTNSAGPHEDRTSPTCGPCDESWDVTGPVGVGCLPRSGSQVSQFLLPGSL